MSVFFVCVLFCQEIGTPGTAARRRWRGGTEQKAGPDPQSQEPLAPDMAGTGSRLRRGLLRALGDLCRLAVKRKRAMWSPSQALFLPRRCGNASGSFRSSLVARAFWKYAAYGFKIHTQAGLDIVKMDPFAQEFEKPSDLHKSPTFNASVVSACDDNYRPEPFEWGDEAWMLAREERGAFALVETRYYSSFSLMGSPDDLKHLINELHKAGLGVIMDFVPAHFCRDACSFGDFDGTPTYEYEDPREGEQRQWGTKIFNFRKNEVRSFLVGSALFWAERYHIDGFRCDAVSAMIYRNFGKADHEWVRNEHGGYSNLEAVSLLRELNKSMKQFWPGVVMIAEESTAWEGVTTLRPTVHAAQ
eukprot:s2863_g8.t1